MEDGKLVSRGTYHTSENVVALCLFLISYYFLYFLFFINVCVGGGRGGKPGMVAYACNLYTPEVEAGDLGNPRLTTQWVGGQPGLHEGLLQI